MKVTVRVAENAEFDCGWAMCDGRSARVLGRSRHGAAFLVGAWHGVKSGKER
jgi:hypothetical protein